MAKAGIQRPKWLCLYVALAFVLGMEVANAWAGERPANAEIGPSTLELRSDRIKFQIIPANEQPPAGFEQPGFDDSSFSTGRGPFGSGGECPLQSTVSTDWPINTQLLTRHVVSIPAGAKNVRIMVSVDNDILGVFFNGTRVADFGSHDGCPIPDDLRFDIAESLVRSGENVVAFLVLDRGVESFFDARVLVDLSPDQVPKTVAVQQAPLVPVRDAVAACSVGSDPLRRNTIIPFAVAATGEFGEIRIEQTPEQLTSETLLGGEQMAFTIATPDVTTTVRSSSATEKLSRLDPGILSIASVFTNQSVLGEMIRCSAATPDASCIDTCNQKANMASLQVSLAHILFRTSGPFGFGGLFFHKIQQAISEAFSHALIEASREQCVAGCTQTPPRMPDDPTTPQPPQPGSLSVSIVFDVMGTQPSQTQGFFQGSLVGQALGPGMTNFSIMTPIQSVAPRASRSVSAVQRNLAGGSWRITGAAQGFTGPNTCNVDVPVGNLRILHLDVSGGRGLKCE